MNANVHHRAEESRYEIEVDGRVVGVAEYHLDGDVMVFPHTVVAPAFRGQGLAERMVREALDDAREAGRQVVPSCWFVREFIDHHAEYRDLLVSAA